MVNDRFPCFVKYGFKTLHPQRLSGGGLRREYRKLSVNPREQFARKP